MEENLPAGVNGQESVVELWPEPAEKPPWQSKRFGKARSCNHTWLKNIQIGTEFYYCPECEWVFFLNPSKYMLKDHMAGTAFGQLQWIVKHFGKEALYQMLRKPHTMGDGGEHRPYLPEGMTMNEFFDALDDPDAREIGAWTPPDIALHEPNEPKRHKIGPKKAEDQQANEEE